jgi:hypothetical protein
MRDRDLHNLLEGIAMRGPGWGKVVSLTQADGTTVATRVSIAGMLRRIVGEGHARAFPMTPRADKGVAYATHRGTRRIVGAAV